jgi:hypothetical protein
LLFEELLVEADLEGINICEEDIGKLKGLYVDGNIILNSSLKTYTEKACVLAEEMGHHHTTVGNILDQSKAVNRKQERRARAWAFERLIDLNSLINASMHGIRNKYELAEYLGVTERFVDKAMQYFREKHGLYCKTSNYIIFFDPLMVIKI